MSMYTQYSSFQAPISPPHETDQLDSRRVPPRTDPRKRNGGKGGMGGLKLGGLQESSIGLPTPPRTKDTRLRSPSQTGPQDPPSSPMEVEDEEGPQQQPRRRSNALARSYSSQLIPPPGEDGLIPPAPIEEPSNPFTVSPDQHNQQQKIASTNNFLSSFNSCAASKDSDTQFHLAFSPPQPSSTHKRHADSMGPSRRGARMFAKLQNLEQSPASSSSSSKLLAPPPPPSGTFLDLDEAAKMKINNMNGPVVDLREGNVFLDRSGGRRGGKPKVTAERVGAREEKPFINYVFRGTKTSFINPYYDQPPSPPNTHLPTSHPEFTPPPNPLPRLLFPPAPAIDDDEDEEIETSFSVGPRRLFAATPKQGGGRDDPVVKESKKRALVDEDDVFSIVDKRSRH